jgi:hypothetical protein
VTVYVWDQSAVERVAPRENCGRNVLVMQAAAQWMELGGVGAVMAIASASATMVCRLVPVDATTQHPAVVERGAKEATHRARSATRAVVALITARPSLLLLRLGRRCSYYGYRG